MTADVPLPEDAPIRSAFEVWRQGVSWTLSQDANHRLVHEAFCAGCEAAAPAIAAAEREACARLIADKVPLQPWLADLIRARGWTGGAADQIDRIEERSRQDERQRICEHILNRSRQLAVGLDDPVAVVELWSLARELGWTGEA